MSDDLTVLEQRQVTFYDDQLTAVRANDGHVYVTLRHMCDALGLDAQGQSRRIDRHTVMAKGMTWVDILSTQGEHQQRRRARVIRIDLVPLWLSGIRTSMVKEELRTKLEKFQEEAAKVLWEAFQSGQLTTSTTIDDLLKSDSPAAQAYKMAMAMAELARNQLMLEARIDNRLNEHETRIEQLESQMGAPDKFVTPDQAMQISQAVKTVAIAQGKQTKRNEFGAVYGELYRKFGITSYKMLPANRFEEAIAFLTDWYGSLEGSEPF